MTEAHLCRRVQFLSDKILIQIEKYFQWQNFMKMPVVLFSPQFCMVLEKVAAAIVYSILETIPCADRCCCFFKFLTILLSGFVFSEFRVDNRHY